ncbi:MAG: hypothetical protein ACP5P4_09725 [Steroidobacteraceae bacterium]
MQLAFDLGAYVDSSTGEPVPWATPDDDLLTAIHAAPWKIVDIETTELNPASKPIEFGRKDLMRGVDPTPRTRVVSVLFPDQNYGEETTVAFEFDQLSVSERRAVSQAVQSGAMFGHNIGFDLGWLWEYAYREPGYEVLDSMLIARAMRPRQPIELAALALDETAEDELRGNAKEIIYKGGGWSLQALALTVLHQRVDKAFQGPRNWCEPVLTQQHYDYATGDVKSTYRLLCELLDVAELHLENPGDILEAYRIRRESSAALQIYDPQVLEVALMRRNGMPWNRSIAAQYVEGQRRKVIEFAERLLALEPSLAKHASVLKDFDAGVPDDLCVTLGEAFRKRGVRPEVTAKTCQPKVGEKDLRRVGAAKTDLFEAWVGLCKAKKAGHMAEDFSGFSERSSDSAGRIRSNIGHGPVTGRLSSSEPNVQQAPGDQGFRDAVHADEGMLMLGVDYGALDVRVAAALAIRTQRQIAEAVAARSLPDGVLKALDEWTVAHAKRVCEARERAFKAHQDSRLPGRESAKEWRDYWKERRELQTSALHARFVYRVLQVRERAQQAGTPEWGSLRDAFSIPGMDIHTWTALEMRGERPLEVFAGVPPDQIADALKVQKKRLGDERKTSGKIPNLALLYRMRGEGLQDYAAAGFDVHWDLDEAEEKLSRWLDSYPEIDLWHCWTEMNPLELVALPDSVKGKKFQTAYMSVDLGGREICAFGINAALSYQDQSTGADILGEVMHRLRVDHPRVFKCVCNQVHDELVLHVPGDKGIEYQGVVVQVMVAAADKFLGPYGVRTEVSPTLARVWKKD